MPPPQPSSRDDFTVAIACALPLEYDAICHTFDASWDEDDDKYGRGIGDPNTYTTGYIGDHNIVLVLLPAMGNRNAAGVATSLRSSYLKIRLALLVGVCGGMPRYENREVFLGDVVISKMVLDADFGRQYSDKFVRKESAQDSLSRPNKEVRSLLAIIETNRGLDRLQQRVAVCLQQLQNGVNGTKYQGKYDYPGAEKDQLLAQSRRHKHHSLPTCICQRCLNFSDPVCSEALRSSCAELGCNDGVALNLERTRSPLQLDLPKSDPQPEIHVGIVASSNWVIKSAMHRDRIHKETGAIAFEMEGAGVWDEVPCIVIKGVCDYADSHKHKGWQKYAAATAASVSKAFLERYTATDEATMKRQPEHEVNGPVFRGPISGHNVVVGTTTTSGGTVNFNFSS